MRGMGTRTVDETGTGTEHDETAVDATEPDDATDEA